jgi:hypothetical protein
MFIVLMVAVVFVNTLAVVTLVSEAFYSGYLIYGLVTVLLAGGIYRANSPLKKGTGTSRRCEFLRDSDVSLGASPLFQRAARSVASFSVMVLLAALAFITLTAGIFYSSYDWAPRSDGPAGASLAELVTDLRKERKLVGRRDGHGRWESRGFCGTRRAEIPQWRAD